MEGQLVKCAPSKKAYEIFQEVFPMYLSIGMSYDEFYNKDSQLVKCYLKAHEMKQKYNNTNMWIQGMYVYDALLRVAPIYHPFSKAGSEAIPYIEEPYALSQEEQEKIENRKQRKHMDKMKAQMEMKADVINKRFRGGEEIGDRG